jgi:hypothetical protein
VTRVEGLALWLVLPFPPTAFKKGMPVSRDAMALLVHYSVPFTDSKMWRY